MPCTEAKALTSRVLPFEEWSKLAGTELADLATHPTRFQAHVLVVEAGDAIIGTWMVLPVWHVEGLWVHPDYRGKASVGRRLWTGMRRLVTALGGQAAMTAAIDPTVEAMLQTAHAQPLPGRAYLLPFGKGE